jgi:hypothetical protein
MDRHTLIVEKSSAVGKFPSYNKPCVIGYFSVDSESNCCGDLRQLKYIHFPTNSGVKFDLDLGRKYALRKDDTNDDKLDNVLTWVLENWNDGNRYVFCHL